MIDFAGGHQAEQRPGGLRRGARRRRVAAIIELVARAVLAPAAVAVLDPGEPSPRLAKLGRGMIDAGDVERAQHRPGAVDVVHAPAAVPAALGVLGAAQVIERAPNRLALPLADL